MKSLLIDCKFFFFLKVFHWLYASLKICGCVLSSLSHCLCLFICLSVCLCLCKISCWAVCVCLCAACGSSPTWECRLSPILPTRVNLIFAHCLLCWIAAHQKFTCWMTTDHWITAEVHLIARWLNLSLHVLPLGLVKTSKLHLRCCLFYQ